MTKKKTKKSNPWYGKWWAIVLFSIAGVIILSSIFGGNSQTKFLTDQNYEVFDYGHNDIAKELPHYDPDQIGLRDFAYVEMRALGSREDQVSDGWIFLGTKYRDASQYTAIIFTESETCRYSIDGEIYQAYLEGLSYWSYENPILMNKSNIENKSDYIYWANILKSDLIKLANDEETEKEYSSYDIKLMLDEYDKLDSTEIDKETIYQIVKFYENDGYCE